jgi:hypothetical protein
MRRVTQAVPARVESAGSRRGCARVRRAQCRSAHDAGVIFPNPRETLESHGPRDEMRHAPPDQRSTRANDAAVVRSLRCRRLRRTFCSGAQKAF